MTFKGEEPVRFKQLLGTCFGYHLVPILSLPVFVSGEVHMLSLIHICKHFNTNNKIMSHTP